MNTKGSAATFGVIFVILILLGLGALFLGVDTVDASHIGVTNQFGKLGTMMPGIQWTGLFTSVEQYDTRIKTMTVDMSSGDTTAVDRDGQTIRARIQVNFRVNPENVLQAYSGVGLDGSLADTLNVEGIVREGFKSTTSNYTSVQIWQNRQQVKEQAISRIKENFPSKYFILENVIIPDIGFNPEFIKAIEQRKTNEQTALSKEAEVAIKQNEAKIAIAVAEGQAETQKRLADSEAYQKLTYAKAEAEALRLKSQELTPLMVQQGYVDKWNGVLPSYTFGQQPNFLMQMPNGATQ